MSVQKGISPLIAAVLLIAFTMAVAGLFAQWAPNLIQNVQEGTSEDARTAVQASKAGVSIETVSTAPVNHPVTSLTFSNNGQVSLENFTVGVLYEERSPETFRVKQSLDPAEIYTGTFHLDGDLEVIRVSSEELPVESKRSIDQDIYNPTKTDFRSEPTKSFVRVLSPDRIRNEYESEGLTNVTEVGDSGEYTDIQTALDNADKGDTILLEEGEYTWEDITIDKDVQILGEGEVLLNGTNSGSGVAFIIGSDASPVIKGIDIWGYDSTAVDAQQTSGNWAVADLEVSTDGSDISPYESTGDWMILDTKFGGSYTGGHYTNINAPRVTGDVLIERVYTRSAHNPINLNGANGSVNIKYSNIGGARGVYYTSEVEKEKTVVKVRESYFTGNYAGAIHATDNAPEVDAKDNYWDESDYESVQSENVDSSNPGFAANTSINYIIP